MSRRSFFGQLAGLLALTKAPAAAAVVPPPVRMLGEQSWGSLGPVGGVCGENRLEGNEERLTMYEAHAPRDDGHYVAVLSPGHQGPIHWHHYPRKPFVTPGDLR